MYKDGGIISLCSKTYHCFGKYDKTNTVGLSKAHNVLKNDQIVSVWENTQRGFGNKY